MTRSATTTSLARTFTSKAAAAKVWAEPYRIHGRPGGYLHTRTADEYAALPVWLQGRTNFTQQVQRLVDTGGTGRSVHGWDDLGAVLIVRGVIRADVGPRGGRTYRLAP